MKRAVIIGVDEYRDDRIQDLEGARNDAQELADLLAKSGDFEVDEPLLGRHATGAAIRSAVSDLLWRTDALDLALLYFSGHAFDDDYGNGFLAPHDMEYERPFANGVRMQEVNDLMLKAVNKDVVLLVLDACKSGIAASGQRGQAPNQAPFEDAFIQLADAEVQGRGRIVLASSGADEKSHERRGCEHQYLGGDAHAHGAFTFQMLEALSGRAASDSEYVNLDDVKSFVERELKGQTLTFFGSGLQHSKQITLVRTTEFVSISTQLTTAAELLDKTEEPLSLFLAIRALTEIQPHTRNNDQAIELKKMVDARLSAERETVSYYLTSKKMDLLNHCPRTCKRVEALLSEISFETLIAIEQDMLGLMVGLWEASQQLDDQTDYRTWLSQMKGVEKHASEPPRIAKSKLPGGGRSSA